MTAARARNSRASRETWRDFELIVDGESDPAFSRAVEFGDDQTIKRAGFVKFFGLVQRVGAGGGIDHQQGEMRCAFILLGNRAADFSEFLHQVVAGVEPAGGIADEELFLVGDRLLVGIETNR